MVLVVGPSGRYVKSLYCAAGLMIAMAIAIVSAAAYDTIPKRSVAGTTVRSSADPAVNIRLPPDILYVGTDKFTISKPSTANECQLFAFAMAGADGRLAKLYWVHFENILPRFPKASMG